MSKGFASNRLTLLAVGVLACFMGVAVRLVFLHVVDRDQLLRFVDKARRQIVVEHARRGTILDTHGNMLATSRSENTVAVDPWALDEYLVADTNEPRRARKRADELAKRVQLASLLGLPVAEVEKAFQPAMRSVKPENDKRDGKVDGLTKDRWVKLREAVDEPTFDKIEALKIRGLTHERIYRRVYPGGGLAAHLIGYLNKEGTSVNGAEHHFDLYLKGQDGWIESEKDGARRELAQFRSREVAVQDGNDVVLTIDSVVQHMIEDELKTIAAKYTPHFATIIVSDPMTGAILGLANYPSYDLNNYSKAPLDAQRNYAVTDMIEPGSTFKIVAAGAALNEGLVTPASTFDCGSTTIDYKGRTIKLPKEDEAFGRLSVAEIVSHSSNRGAAQLGMLLGEQRFYDYARKYGFGQSTAFPLGGEVRGMLEAPDKWDGLTISRMPMGHSIAATPLQVHCAMSAVANGGTLLRPQIIKEIRDNAGNVIRTFAPEKRTQVLKPGTAALLAQLLTGVVREGTAKGFDIPGFEIAGKTGTTQKLVDGKYVSNRHVASFVGFFPASRPEVVISVIVDDAKVAGGIAYGRVVAAPAFHHIAEQLIQYLDIQPPVRAGHTFLAMQGCPVIGYLTPNYPLVAAFRSLPLQRTRASSRTTPKIFKMAPKLSDYFQDGDMIASKGDLDRPISGLAMDSRRVMAGNLFFALPGRRADGNSFIDEAINRGAVAIVAEKIPSGTAARVTYIQVADARRALALVSQRFFGFPDKSLDLVGVTGTNGKTTVTNLIKHLLSTNTQRVGLIGTVHYDLGARVVPSYRTTPESLELFGMLAQMRDAGCRQAAMEVSSHGIDQHRIRGMQFGVAVFTNLTRDHLDYHQTMESYFEVKSRLFTGAAGVAPRAAAINLDDPYGRQLAASVPKHVKVVTFGESPEATVRAENVRLHFKSTQFRLVWPEGALEIESPFIGRFNVSNLLAAFAACYALGRDPQVVAARLKSFPGVPGRMERIEEGQPYNVLVDYAHTDDALRNALGMLRAITPGRLFVVFGCGGNRDRAKRSVMTAVVQEFADHAWATADNPRSEPLAQIFSDMKAGVTSPEKIAFVEDRRRALSLALDAAREGDCLLIAGKGHETYQEFADTIVPFDDRQVVRELIAIKKIKPV